MTRRSPIRLALGIAAAAAALTGCATFDNTDVVAHVEGAELTRAQFEEILREQVPADEARITGDEARSIAAAFVATEVVKADLTTLDIELPDVDRSGLTAAQALQDESQTAIEAWTSLPASTLLDDTLRDAYGEGPEASGFTCASHILVDDEEAALEALGLIEGGAAFAEVAAALSIDPGSAQAGGRLGCVDTGQFELQFVPEFVEAALDAEIGVATRPVASEFGYHLIRLLPADELSAADILPIRVASFPDRYDIEISPLIGTWDPTSLIAPLG